MLQNKGATACGHVAQISDIWEVMSTLLTHLLFKIINGKQLRSHDIHVIANTIVFNILDTKVITKLTINMALTKRA